MTNTQKTAETTAQKIGFYILNIKKDASERA